MQIGKHTLKNNDAWGIEMQCLAAGVLLLWSVPAMCADTVATAATPPSAAASSPHEGDTANIRLHRLRHLDARLNTDPADLHAQCRYESEISTRPPQKHLALTFDDGPEPVQTEYILEVLRRHGARATFFMIGEQVKKDPELLAKVLADGHHLVANHSWDHPNFHAISVAEQLQEVEATEQALAQNMPHKLFRYPYGNSTCETNAYLHKQGYQIIGWHIDSCDWAFDKTGSVDAREAATCAVLPQFQSDYVGHVIASMRAHNGGIVLMHEIHPNTLKKLDEILQQAVADGFVFDALDAPEFDSSMR